MTKEDDAFWQGALNCCAVAVTFFFVIWVLLSPLRAPTCPASTAVAAPAPPPPPARDEDRLVHELCDREVDALLHSRDPLDLQRAIEIVKQIPCAIERRL